MERDLIRRKLTQIVQDGNRFPSMLSGDPDFFEDYLDFTVEFITLLEDSEFREKPIGFRNHLIEDRPHGHPEKFFNYIINFGAWAYFPVHNRFIPLVWDYFGNPEAFLHQAIIIVTKFRWDHQYAVDVASYICREKINYLMERMRDLSIKRFEQAWEISANRFVEDANIELLRSVAES